MTSIAHVDDVNAVINRARLRVHKAQRKLERNARKDKITQVVATALGVLANKVTAPNSKVGAMQFIDMGTRVMQDGYTMAYKAGVLDAYKSRELDQDTVTFVANGQASPDPAFKAWAHIAGLVGLDPALKAFDMVKSRAAAQHHFLVNLYHDILTKPIVKGWVKDAVKNILADLGDEDVSDDEEDAGDLGSRLDLYGDTTTAPYEMGYADGSLAGGAARCVWHIQDDDACDQCTDRDDQIFTEDDLPGYPGDGDFGDLCDGGPRCRCWLEWLDQPEVTEAARPVIVKRDPVAHRPGGSAGGRGGKTVDPVKVAATKKTLDAYNKANPRSTQKATNVKDDREAGVRALRSLRVTNNLGKPGFVSKAEFARVSKIAEAKVRAVRTPLERTRLENAYKIAKSLRPGDELRGNTTDRAVRADKLIHEFGDGEHACCVHCGQVLTSDTISQDKIFTADQGGRYTMDNLLSSCLSCNNDRNDTKVIS